MYKLNEIDQVAKRLVETIDVERATIIAMEGELGAGKTAVTKELAKILGIRDEITSPTFVLNVQYPIPLSAQLRAGNSQSKFEHIDLWRMEEFGELLQIGLLKMIEEKAIIVLEWADKFKDEVQRLNGAKVQVMWVKINYLKNDDEREIQIDIIR